MLESVCPRRFPLSNPDRRASGTTERRPQARALARPRLVRGHMLGGRPGGGWPDAGSSGRRFVSPLRYEPMIREAAPVFRRGTVGRVLKQQGTSEDAALGGGDPAT